MYEFVITVEERRDLTIQLLSHIWYGVQFHMNPGLKYKGTLLILTSCR